MAEASPAPRRNWLPRLAGALLLPVVLVVGLEIGLRVGGYGRDVRFFIPDEAATDGVYRSNPRFTELFFPASFALKPVNFRLPREKPDGTKRVFVLGESAAMGVPEPGFGMVPQMQALWRESFPDASVEVHNLGVTAINSHVILPIFEQALEFDPDLMVIYMGSNEFVGPYGPGSAINDAAPSLRAIRAGVWFKHLRIGQLLDQFAQRRGAANSSSASNGEDSAERDWRGLEMFANKQVTDDDPRRETTYANFEANLHRMLALAAAADVPVLLSTVAVNVSTCAPFSDDAEAASLFAQGHELLQAGQRDAALASLREARDADVLRFRADSRINAIVREAAESFDHVRLVDNEDTVGLGGRGLFFEHVHFTFEGNYAVALNFVASAHEFLFPDRRLPPPPDPQTVADAVGFTPVGRLSQWQTMNDLVRRPPFTGQDTYAADRTYALRKLQELNQVVSQQGVPRFAGQVNAARIADPTNPFLAFHAAKLASQQGNHQRVLDLLDTYEALAPVSAESTVLRAFAVANLGRPAAAIERLRALAEHEPHYPQTYPLLASFWISINELDTAKAAFADWAARYPDIRGVRLAYAQVLEAAGDLTAAATEWQAVLTIVPDDERALWPLIQHLIAQDDFDGAVDLMLSAHAYNPRNATNNDRLVQVFQQKRDFPRALAFMEDLMQSGPVSPELRRDYERLRAQVNSGASP